MTKGRDLRRGHIGVRQLMWRRLETGTYEALQAYARQSLRAHHPRGASRRHEVVGNRAPPGATCWPGSAVCRRTPPRTSTSSKPHSLDAYEPARPTAFAGHRWPSLRAGSAERIIREAAGGDPRAIGRRCSRFRERLLILPIIGVIDPQRARPADRAAAFAASRDQSSQGRRASTSRAWPYIDSPVANQSGGRPSRRPRLLGRDS